MRLLVSAADALDAAAAVAGGADFVDAKDPAKGPLGAVSLQHMRGIWTAVAGATPVTAALGDAVDEESIEHAARAFASVGLAFVKIGFMGVVNRRYAERLMSAAVRGARRGRQPACGIVAVAYADADAVSSLSPAAIADIASHTDAKGVLLDTADKRGPGLPAIVPRRALASWVARAHIHGLFAAVAGKLTIADLAMVCDCGADIAGVRGAACEGGRSGRVTADRVRLLKAACGVLPMCV